MTEYDVDKNAGLGFALVVMAGLSTAIGAAVVFFRQLVHLANKLVLAAGLGFSAGVMFYVSFVEIFVKSNGAFTEHGMEENDAYTVATACFFAGLFMMKVLGWLTQKLDSKHECCHDAPLSTEGSPSQNEASSQPSSMPGGEEGAANLDGIVCEDGNKSAAETQEKVQGDEKALRAMGLKTALAIGIHNFPEGLATFVATLADPTVGATLAVAIAIHNIPEGLCVALPIYYATGSKVRGFLWALLSGLSEPFGALLGYAVIKASGEDLNQLVYGVLFGVVAGMMVGICVIELLPTAQKYDPNDKFLTWSVMFGMLVMSLSLVLFQY